MKNILKDPDFAEISQRIRSLHPDLPSHWGKMTCSQMVCHVTDPIRESIGVRTTPPHSNFLTKSVIKWVVLYGPVWSKGKLATSDSYNQEKNGTPPSGFENDRDVLLKLLSNFRSANRYFPHPVFGTLSRNEWGRLMFRHLDHHLGQFGQ
ncbi:MAG: DUF1569 domain-containing protein [Bacteroidia bacterium]|nr:DUF1569 domain-containing protein [Bacteroidia bacterium]